MIVVSIISINKKSSLNSLLLYVVQYLMNINWIRKNHPFNDLMDTLPYDVYISLDLKVKEDY